MNALGLSGEAAVRLYAFVGVFAVMALWEVAAPRRKLSVPKGRRWLINFGITVLDSLLLLVFSAGAVGVAVSVAQRGDGAFNVLSWPGWLEVLLSVLALDLLIYVQHIVFHRVSWLWRFHMVHHTDLDLDVTSGTRFHPFEILLSMFIKAVAVAALGAPAMGVLIFEILLNGSSVFNHSNVQIPAKLDSLIRMLIVTPDMHRVHHSVLLKECSSNYGFNLAVWDRLFGTYCAQPRDGHDGMKIGISRIRDISSLGLISLLALPFVKYPFGRRDRHDPGPRAQV